MIQSLNGTWSMKRVGFEELYEAKVPTTMYQVLYENGVIADPFYGENDLLLTELSEADVVFARNFSIDFDPSQMEEVLLRFDGLDTLATVTLNDVVVLTAENMHRTYEVDVKDVLEEDNELVIYFDSPNEYIAKAQAKDPLWGVENGIPGYEYIRKAHHMFGWDWGPQLPDMGIWRDVSLIAVSKGRLVDFYVTQDHGDGGVNLGINVTADVFSDDLALRVVLTNPQGEVVYDKVEPTSGDSYFSIDVVSPQIWWPNGYGDQPLYGLTMQLECGDGGKIDTISKKIGLRTMTMTREADKFGESFDMTVNGVRIFAMGGDYIPEDALIGRMNPDRTEKLVKSCVAANFNHLRVWGGAFYPHDYFYDLCDQYGLLVWQDFMFACGVYRLTERFEANIRGEFEDNIKRIRHHASLGLWCGNNEMEWGFMEWAIPKDERLKMDYLLMYEKIIPNMLEELDPNTFYWPASPSSGGGFLEPNADHKGDVHYWNVFHGGEHYKAYRKHYFRFASEYGMQSFPDMKTIKTYGEASQGDFKIYGPVMEDHNKCLGSVNGNMKIMMNMAGEFNLPNNLEEVVYISQLFQGEAIKCAIEHFRRNRGRCMGSTFWQVNDNYPVASWASIDVFGRWKGLHYQAKRSYASVLVSGYEEGFLGHIHVTNEQLTDFNGKLTYELVHQDKGVLESGRLDVVVPALTAAHIITVDAKPYITKRFEERDIYLRFHLTDVSGKILGEDAILFTFHKYFDFRPAAITITGTEEKDMVTLTLKADQFVKAVAVSFENVDVILSDNYLNLYPGEAREVTFGLPEGVSLKEILDGMSHLSVNNCSWIM